MLLKTAGIIFRTKKYSETSVIADIFTEAKGLRSYIISGVRSQRARVSAGLLQVMTPVDLVAYHREDREMTRLKEIKALHVFQQIPFDIRRSAVGMFMLEMARNTVRGQEENPELFHFLLENFLYLDAAQTPVGNLHLHFIAHLSGFSGFAPGGVYSEASPFFDLKEGLYCDLKPAHHDWLSPLAAEKLNFFLRFPKERSHEVVFQKEEKKIFLKNMIHYYRLHIENFPSVHSHEVLEEVMG